MATSPRSPSARRVPRRRTARATPCMSARQLDAYLQAREALRRVGAIARSTVRAARPLSATSPP